MASIITNSSGKLRSGWRITVFLFLFILFAIFLWILETTALVRLSPEPHAARTLHLIFNGAGLLFISLLLGGSAGKWFENLPFSALGASFTKGWFKQLLLGSIVGAASLLVAILIVFLADGIKFQINPAGTSSVLNSLIISFMVIAINAAWEEAFFRGYIFQTLTRSNLAWLAIILTSAFFGSVHAGNPNATMISTINTVLAGIWFGLAYLKTRNLWFVWGMHLMWNWLQGGVFGIEISGLTDLSPDPLLREIDSGPTWLTGSTYGIEGGIACTVAIVLSMTAIYLIPTRSNHIET